MKEERRYVGLSEINRAAEKAECGSVDINRNAVPGVGEYIHPPGTATTEAYRVSTSSGYRDPETYGLSTSSGAVSTQSRGMQRNRMHLTS